MGSAGYAQIVPVELVRTFFIADPVLLRVPERTGFERNHAKACPGEALHQNAPGASHPNDAVVDGLILVESPRWPWERLHRTQAMRHQWLPPCPWSDACSGGASSSINPESESTGGFHS